MRRLERRQKENDDLKADLKELRENKTNSITLLRKQNIDLKEENDRLKARIHGLMTNYERYVN